jgi:riboflavin synthase
MFTGLIEAVGKVIEREPTVGQGFRLRLDCPLASELGAGDSLAVNGVCLTVVSSGPREVRADIGPETARVTTLGGLVPGGYVNVERPLRADGRIGGHLVQGHVDAVGQVEGHREDSDCHWFTVSFPRDLTPFIVHKGSIAVDGISLTVAVLGTDRFDVQIVPYTMTHTNLSQVRVRDRVNLECDMIGKYVVRAAEIAGLSLTGGAR